MINRRAVSIGICTVILLIIIAFVVGFVTSSPKTPAGNTTLNNVSQNGLVSYEGDSYTLFYPEGWQQPISAPKADGTGTELYVSPQSEMTATMDHVTLDILDANKTTLSSARNTYITYGYPEEDTTVSGVSAERYAKIDPTSDGTYHTIVYIFQNNESIYLLKLGYKKDSRDTRLERKFNQMVNAFVLK